MWVLRLAGHNGKVRQETSRIEKEAGPYQEEIARCSAYGAIRSRAEQEWGLGPPLPGRFIFVTPEKGLDGDSASRSAKMPFRLAAFWPRSPEALPVTEERKPRVDAIPASR